MSYSFITHLLALYHSSSMYEHDAKEANRQSHPNVKNYGILLRIIF